MHTSKTPQLLRRDYRGYIVVVGKSTTDEWYKTLLDFSTLEVDDPPPVCVAPSTGRFEVRCSLPKLSYRQNFRMRRGGVFNNTAF